MKYLIQLLPGTYACPRLDRSNRCTPRLLGRESLVLVLGILCLGCSAVGQNLVSNGSFELPVVSGSFIQRNAGTTMSGWTVGGGGIDHIGNFWMAAATNQSVDLNAASAGSVYQLLSTTPDTRYVLRFALAGNPFGYSNKVMSVLWGGLPLTNLVFYWYATNSVTNMGWQYYSLVVTSTAASTRLEFASLTGAMNGAGLCQRDGFLTPGPGRPGSDQRNHNRHLDHLRRVKLPAPLFDKPERLAAGEWLGNSGLQQLE